MYRWHKRIHKDSYVGADVSSYLTTDNRNPLWQHYLKYELEISEISFFKKSDNGTAFGEL
jgi:hypothetical protein